MIEYKEILLLSYFNISKSSYSYQYILQAFGLNINQLDDIMNKLIYKKYIIFENEYKITCKAIKLLEEYGMKDFNYLEIQDEKNIFLNDPLEIEQIYIPKKFTKKYKYR